MGSADDLIAGRMLDMAVGTFDLLSVALGDALGYYRHLTEDGELCAAELAAKTGTVERYAREWLEQQTATGFCELADSTLNHEARRFRLAAGVASVLASRDDLNYLAPLTRQLVAAALQFPAVITAARSGEGVPWTAYGADMRESEGDLNRPGYLHLLADEWLAAVPDVRRRLRADPPARVADVGCGAGWSTIGLARGYPLVCVDAFETDPASVELARRNIAQAGLADRVHVYQQDIAAVAGVGDYDLVTVFECLHDLPYPVEALRAMRGMVGSDGTVLLADMKVADGFAGRADPIERLVYGFSLMVCLPDSMSHPNSTATGAVMRRSTLHGYAAQAGFSVVETLPVDHDLWRFYRLQVESG